MSIKTDLKYNATKDRIVGFEDFGNLGQSARTASEALAFMVRGIFKKWKQPIGYFFSSGATPASILNDIVLEAIDKIEAAGGIVKAIIANQGGPNRKLFRNRSATSVFCGVFLAAQILSHSVFAGMSTCVKFRALPPEAQHTADFV